MDKYIQKLIDIDTGEVVKEFELKLDRNSRIYPRAMPGFSVRLKDDNNIFHIYKIISIGNNFETKIKDLGPEEYYKLKLNWR